MKWVVQTREDASLRIPQTDSYCTMVSKSDSRTSSRCSSSGFSISCEKIGSDDSPNVCHVFCAVNRDPDQEHCQNDVKGVKLSSRSAPMLSSRRACTEIHSRANSRSPLQKESHNRLTLSSRNDPVRDLKLRNRCTLKNKDPLIAAKSRSPRGSKADPETSSG